MNEDQRIAQPMLEEAHQLLEDIHDYNNEGMTACHRDRLARAKRLIESVLNDLDRTSTDSSTRIAT